MLDKKTNKVHLVSLGCPKNTVDTEKMQGLLKGNAYELTSDPHEADVVVVNTCGFIGPAKEESIDAIMQAQTPKPINRRPRISPPSESALEKINAPSEAKSRSSDSVRRGPKRSRSSPRGS